MRAAFGQVRDHGKGRKGSKEMRDGGGDHDLHSQKKCNVGGRLFMEINVFELTGSVRFVAFSHTGH